MHTAVGGKGAKPHIHIAGRTCHPQRPFTGNPLNRKQLKLAVGIRLGQLPTITHLSGTNYAGAPEVKKYKNATGKLHSRMAAKEYTDFLQTTTQELGKPKPAVIVQDRESTHMAKLTQEWAKKEGIRLLTLPPRSPDLDPLDYGVFGPFKASYEALKFAKHVPWDAACKAVVEGLKTTKVENAVQAWEKRLRACIAAKGKHFECDMKGKKRAGPLSPKQGDEAVSGKKRRS